MRPTEIVEGFFTAMERRRWAEAAGFLSDEIHVWWPVTDEHFRGGDFIAMQEAYPEGWAITVVEVIASGDRVAARIAVDQDGKRFWCFGWYDVSDQRIVEAVELWATEGSETPPDWRRRFAD